MSTRTIAALTALALLGASTQGLSAAPVAAATQTWIVQAATSEAAKAHLARVNARVEQELPIIRAASAQLTPAQVQSLQRDPAVRLYAERGVMTSGDLVSLLKGVTNNTNSTLASTFIGGTTTYASQFLLVPVLSIELVRSLTQPLVYASSSKTTLQDGTGVKNSSLTYETNYPALIDADRLQDAGTTGAGVTIAVLDTGLWQDTAQNYGSRILASIDVVNGGKGTVKGDPFGHGTHITAVAASGQFNLAGRYAGIAPRANLVVVRAFDGEGAARYSDVIAGLNWIVANKNRYNIRVLNLSFGAAPQSYYWDDPLNQAVMAAWRAGIVVVVASGNEGPSPMTVAVPGNVP
jgi:subtilisin family serine protease